MTRTLFEYVADNRYSRPLRVRMERIAFSLAVPRRVANWLYNATSNLGRSKFHQRSAKIFRNHTRRFRPGVWNVNVGPFRLRMPLRADHAWLDWDIALSILGHDAEVVDFYAKILRSIHRPQLFLDIGANYGMHTALFLSAGVTSIAFEPNPDCRVYFDRLLELNQFGCVKWEPVALGDTNGSARLMFSAMDTWLGTVKADLPELGPPQGSTILNVPIRRLDDLAIENENCFAKIDTEGAEIDVLRGGRNFFREKCAFFVFESLPWTNRPELFDEIASLGFGIEALPVPDMDRTQSLDLSGFLAAKGMNFLARNLREATPRHQVSERTP